MKLYKEAGVNPLGCFSGMLLQFPILIALYRMFSLAVGEAPESLIALHDRLYAVGLPARRPAVAQRLPLAAPGPARPDHPAASS